MCLSLTSLFILPAQIIQLIRNLMPNFILQQFFPILLDFRPLIFFYLHMLCQIRVLRNLMLMNVALTLLFFSCLKKNSLVTNLNGKSFRLTLQCVIKIPSRMHVCIGKPWGLKRLIRQI